MIENCVIDSLSAPKASGAFFFLKSIVDVSLTILGGSFKNIGNVGYVPPKSFIQMGDFDYLSGNSTKTLTIDNYASFSDIKMAENFI